MALKVFGLLLLFAVTASAQETADRVFHLLTPTYSAVAAWDAKGTIDCVESGICTESNPIMRPFVERHGIRTAMAGKMAVHGGILGGLSLIRHRWPKQKLGVNVALITLTVLQGYVDYRNYETLRNARK